MTLIVARIYEDELQIDSDTLTTDPRNAKGQSPFVSSILKIIIFNQSISVSFAGDVEKAHAAIREIYDLNDFKLELIKTILLRSNLKSENHVDYIIAATGESNVLYKVSNGTIEEGNVFWIGDYEGFYKFRENSIAVKNEYGDFYGPIRIQEEAFKYVVEDSSVPSVGGLQVTIRSYNRKQNYPCMSFMITGRDIELLPITELQPIFRGVSAETGTFAVNYINSEPPFHPLLGIYFVFGKFGMLFYPRYSNSAIVFSQVSFNTFRQKIREQFKIETCGSGYH